MKFNVTEIEFDLNDSLSEEYQLTFDDDRKIEVSYILSSNAPIKCKEMVEKYDS